MSSNYQQKKMMNARGAIDTKGNIVLEQFQDGTALLFQPGNAQPFCVATDYHLEFIYAVSLPCIVAGENACIRTLQGIDNRCHLLIKCRPTGCCRAIRRTGRFRGV